MTLYFIRLKR